MAKPTQTTEKLWTPANIVTLLRICGVPVFVIVFISPWPMWIPEWSDADSWKSWIAAIIFILLAATDGLDGYLARSRGEVTNFGKFIDPLADKILVVAALLALIELSVLPSWVALVIICREFIVSGIRMVAANQGIVIAASWYGKAKTVFQIIAIVLFIIKDSRMPEDITAMLGDTLYLVSWGFMIVAVALTIISMLDYFVKAREVLGFPSSKDKQTVSSKESDRFELTPDSLFSDNLLHLGKEVLTLAAEKNKSLGFAESCTGGLLAALLTDISGSSAVVDGGIVSYSNGLKEKILAVEGETLSLYGAVSEQTACEMAAGALKALESDITISITGVAGPQGGSKDKPVGLVWIGWSDGTSTAAQEHHFDGSREEVRLQSVHAALMHAKALL